MAGSLRKFRYISDDGVTYSINRDESNHETLNAGSATLPVAGTPSLPDGYETRYALLSTLDGTKKRRVTILTPTLFAAITGGTDYTLQVVGSSAGEVFRVSSLIGEKRKGLLNGDTGQNDGDNEIAP